MVSRVLILWDFFLGAPMIRYWSSHGHRLRDMWQMWLYMSDRFNSLWNKSLKCFLLRDCYAVIIYVFQPNQNNNISLCEWIKVFKRFSGVQKRWFNETQNLSTVSRQTFRFLTPQNGWPYNMCGLRTTKLPSHGCTRLLSRSYITHPTGLA